MSPPAPIPWSRRRMDRARHRSVSRPRRHPRLRCRYSSNKIRHSRVTLSCRIRFKINRVSPICNRASLYTLTLRVVISSRIYCLRANCSPVSRYPRCSMAPWVWILAPTSLRANNRACRSSRSASNSNSKCLNRSHNSNLASLKPIRPCSSHNSMDRFLKTIIPCKHYKSSNSQTTPSCPSSNNRTPTLRISLIWCTWGLKTVSKALSRSSSVSIRTLFIRIIRWFLNLIIMHLIILQMETTRSQAIMLLHFFSSCSRHRKGGRTSSNSNKLSCNRWTKSSEAPISRIMAGRVVTITNLTRMAIATQIRFSLRPQSATARWGSQILIMAQTCP